MTEKGNPVSDFGDFNSIVDVYKPLVSFRTAEGTLLT